MVLVFIGFDFCTSGKLRLSSQQCKQGSHHSNGNEDQPHDMQQQLQSEYGERSQQAHQS